MLEKRLLTTIKLLLYITLFAPAVVTYFTVYPFLHGKVFWIEIFTEIALGLYLILVLMNREYAPQNTALFWSVSGFTAALIFSTIFSVDRSISFWGDWSRMTGLVLYLHLFAFFIIFSSIIKKEADRRGYLIFFSLLGTILSIFAWIQRYNTKFLRAAWVGSRVGSTLDNPAFFAIFLIFVIFINLWLFFIFKENNQKWRWFFIGSAIFNFCTIFITQTRGVILGTLVGIFLFLGLKFLSSSLKLKLYTLGALVIFAILYSASVFQNFLRSLPGLGRVLESTITDSTLATRLLTWGIAWQAWLARPLVGWGHEAFYAAFNKFYKPEFVKYSFSETWFDKSHNLFLDLLSMNGILGLAGFIAIFIFGFFSFRKRARDRALYVSFTAAYFTSNFFEFDTPASLLAIFFVFACINSDSNDTNYTRITRMQNIRIRPSYTIVIATVIVLFIWFIPIKGVIGSARIDRMGDVAEKKDIVQGIELYQDAIKENVRFSEPATLEYANNLTRLFHERDDALVAFRDHYDLALARLEALAAKHKFDVNYALAYAALANTLSTADASFAAKSESILAVARQNTSPKRQQVLLMIGETKLLLDKTEEAIELLRQAQDLAPTSKHIAYRLAVGFFAGGHEKEGFAQLKKARILGMDESGAQPLLIFISVQAGKGNWIKVTELYEKAVLLEPTNARLYAQMATAYATIGNRKKARGAVLKAMELDSKLRAEGEAFLRQLK